MTSRTAQTRKWMRMLIVFLGTFAVAISIVLFCLASESASSRIAKFTLLPLICLGGLWLIFIGIRGRAKDMDEAADRFRFRR